MSAKINNFPRLRQALVSGVAYGVGLVLGNLIFYPLFQSLSLDNLSTRLQAYRTLIGVFIAFITFGSGGALGGFIGGLTLPVLERPRKYWGYAWQSAFSLGLAFASIILLLILMFSLISGTPGIFFIIAGGVFGALVGAVLGLTTFGLRRSKPVLLASVAGFALGGIGLGYGILAYMSANIAGSLDRDKYLPLLAGLFIFGLAGGCALGYAYSQPETGTQTGEKRTRSPRIVFTGYVLISALLVMTLYTLRPVIVGLWEFFTPHQMTYTNMIKADVIGTHWSSPSKVVETDRDHSPLAQMGLAASTSDSTAIVWSQNVDGVSEVFFDPGTLDEHQRMIDWGDPINVSISNQHSLKPQVVYDRFGFAHLVWIEAGRDGGWAIMYSRCTQHNCEPPIQLSTPTLPTCTGADALSGYENQGGPAIAANYGGEIMVVWQDGCGGMNYSRWTIGDDPALKSAASITLEAGDQAGPASLSAHPEGHFVLVFENITEDGRDILTLRSKDQGWELPTQRIGEGVSPDLIIDHDGHVHITWCGVNEGVHYWTSGNSEVISELPCLNSPDLAIDDNDNIHVVWSSNVVLDVNDQQRISNVIYESIKQSTDWTRPYIVAQIDSASKYALTNEPDGGLLLSWNGSSNEVDGILYALQSQYNCEQYQPTGIAYEVLKVARNGKYRPTTDIVPFCQNQYDQLLITPNPDPAYSEQPSTPNGGFDQYTDLIREAKYEVLFTTMTYSAAKNHDSPGALFADAVADLYQNIKQNPEQYPRGMTVRILLGISPPISTLNLNSMLSLALTDLRNAGVEEMVNPDIGWRLEIAKYAETYPYSHVKLMVIDGKTAITSGFNHEYRPLPVEHRSGLGEGDMDTGIQVTGPVAQDARRVFDGLWVVSMQRHCSDISPGNRFWKMTCRNIATDSEHVPEVMRYYPTEGDTIALSMFRSNAHDEADRQIEAAFASANESIDILQAMFSMPLICNLNYFFDVCTFEHTLSYMKSLMEAVETNGTSVRVLINAHPPQGIENMITKEIFEKEAKSRGLEDRVELRFFDGLVHAKNALIDDQFLFVGSHNLHYSALGDGNGLAEHSIGVTDTQATEEFMRLFEYYWQEAGD